MKKIIVWLIMSMLFASCEKSDSDPDVDTTDKNSFLVDKIYDYHDTLIGEFYYNDKNQLIKALWDTHYDYFAYENDRVKEIRRVVTNYDNIGITTTNLYYDNHGRIIKVGYNGAEPVTTYSYLPNGLLDLPGIEYDENSNIVRFSQILTDPDPMGGPEKFEWIGEYEYDEMLKPNFGIGDIFIYSPLFNYSTDAQIPNNLSLNNITKFSIKGQPVSTYIYKYNKHGLPISIETKWEGIETVEPMIWKLRYKKIIE